MRRRLKFEMLQFLNVPFSRDGQLAPFSFESKDIMKELQIQKNFINA